MSLLKTIEQHLPDTAFRLFWIFWMCPRRMVVLVHMSGGVNVGAHINIQIQATIHSRLPVCYV